MIHHSSSWYIITVSITIMIFHDFWVYIMIPHDLSWNAMKTKKCFNNYQDISWCIMICNDMKITIQRGNVDENSRFNEDVSISYKDVYIVLIKLKMSKIKEHLLGTLFENTGPNWYIQKDSSSNAYYRLAVLSAVHSSLHNKTCPGLERYFVPFVSSDFPLCWDALIHCKMLKRSGENFMSPSNACKWNRWHFNPQKNMRGLHGPDKNWQVPESCYQLCVSFMSCHYVFGVRADPAYT